jgi:putative exosortase-associated protein (TIGR04073 family)
MTTPSKSPRPFLVGCLFVFTILLVWELPRAWADDSITVHMAQKFLRGAANVTMGIGELPKQMYLHSQHHHLTGLLPGLFDGIGMSVVRISAGVCDVSTFLLPLPPHYEPLLTPVFVWEQERRGDRDAMSRQGDSVVAR